MTPEKQKAFWDAAAEAEKQIATWPEWKRKAAERQYYFANGEWPKGKAP